MVLNIGDLDAFTGFLRVCAGSTGLELNLARLGADIGISQPTAKAWLSVLEASFICFRLPAWHPHFRKRLVKAPNLGGLGTGPAAAGRADPPVAPDRGTWSFREYINIFIFQFLY